MPSVVVGQRVAVLDPACGDGRFLAAAAERVEAAGGLPVLHGVDIDPGAVATAGSVLAGFADVRLDVDDALSRSWGGPGYDVVLGNPPFLSPLVAEHAVSRAGAHRPGPYADVAAEFLDLAIGLAWPDGGRVGVVLPQSILGARDAAPVRARVNELAERTWSWWSPSAHFDDAAVVVCALGFQRRPIAAGGNHAFAGDDRNHVWTDTITSALGVPALPQLATGSRLGDHVTLTANFRDEYYGLVPAVDDHADGPPLVTSGLIDPNRCLWGRRDVTFLRRRFRRPRVDVDRLDTRMRRWAERLAVPKVLIANQTRVVECFADHDGAVLPAVPVITARGHGEQVAPLDAVAAVLSSPIAAASLWHAVAGTGMSGRTMRLRPSLLADLPWPEGSLDVAAASFAADDLAASAIAVHQAYGIDNVDGGRLLEWWAGWSPPPPSTHAA